MIHVNVTDTLQRFGKNRAVEEDVAVGLKSHNVSRRQAIVTVFQLGLLYSVGAVIALAFREDVAPDIFLLFLSFWGSLCFFTLWRKINWGDYRFTSFGALFVIGSACFRVLSFFDVLIFGNRIENWPIIGNDPLLSITYGEFVFVAGALTLLSMWFVFRGREKSIEIFKNWHYDYRTLVAAYVTGVVVLLGNRVYGFDLEYLGSILHVFTFITMISVILLSFNSFNRRKWSKYVFFPLLLCAPLVYAALGTGMKENIVISALPVVIGLFLVVKGAWKRALVGVMMVTVLAGSTVFVNIVREFNWREGLGLSPVQVFDLTVDAFRSDKNLWVTALENFTMRKNLLEVSGWAFVRVENYGHQEEFSPFYTYQIFIPRFLWAEKPQFRPGADFSDLVYGRAIGDGTSIAAGFFSALYLSSGLWGVLIYSMMLGALYALSLSVVIRFGSSFAQIILLTGLGYRALRLDEGWPIYEFAGLISLLLTSILFGNFLSFMQRRLKVSPSLSLGRRTSEPRFLRRGHG